LFIHVGNGEIYGKPCRLLMIYLYMDK